jgi:uncharacterized protein (TIGR02271 family)
MLELHDVREAEGMEVTDPDGNRIGKVETIYLDNITDQPEFALVNTGMFGTRSSFVPLIQATLAEGRIQVPHSKDQVKDAPQIDADAEISEQEEEQIYRYYAMAYEGDAGGDAGQGPVGGERTGREPAGHDTSGPNTDDAMTRSEEELHVGKRSHETGKVRLRKFVDTVPVHETVQIRHEEAHIEREPITDANVDQATSGPEISEEEHEVILRSEEPVVEKRTVPKERVRVEKDVEFEEHEVSEELRKERIESDEQPRR